MTMTIHHDSIHWAIWALVWLGVWLRSFWRWAASIRLTIVNHRNNIRDSSISTSITLTDDQWFVLHVTVGGGWRRVHGFSWMAVNVKLMAITMARFCWKFRCDRLCLIIAVKMTLWWPGDAFVGAFVPLGKPEKLSKQNVWFTINDATTCANVECSTARTKSPAKPHELTAFAPKWKHWKRKQSYRTKCTTDGAAAKAKPEKCDWWHCFVEWPFEWPPDGCWVCNGGKPMTNSPGRKSIACRMTNAITRSWTECIENAVQVWRRQNDIRFLIIRCWLYALLPTDPSQGHFVTLLAFYRKNGQTAAAKLVMTFRMVDRSRSMWHNNSPSTLIDIDILSFRRLCDLKIALKWHFVYQTVALNAAATDRCEKKPK